MLKTVCDTRPGTTLASWELFSILPEFFLLDVSVRALFRFVSLRRAYYGLVWPFSISVFSPVVKRGKLCSGNRGLGIVIGADNSRFLTSGFPSRALLPREVESLRSPIFYEPF